MKMKHRAHRAAKVPRTLVLMTSEAEGRLS